MKVNGKRHYLWRAVDHEGEVLEAVVTRRRNKKAALKFLWKLMKRHGRAEEIVTDRFASYKAALRELGAADKQLTGRWPQQPCREFTLTSSTTRAGDATLPTDAKFTEVRRRPFLRLQPLQPRA